MVKYFSVDWLAQSHQGPQGPQDPQGPAEVQERRPHVPCLVQPSAPAFGKGYLQPKPKPSRPAELEEIRGPQDSFCSSLTPAKCSSPISEVSGYSSGYESEAASSECLSLQEEGETEKDGSRRRVRTKFTPQQISKLEKIFCKHKYLDAGERVKTAQRLNLSETQVRTWFQNRRMKLKREMQDYLSPQIPPAFQPLHRVQYQVVPGPGPRYPDTGRGLFPLPLPLPQLLLQHQIPLHPQHVLIRHPHFY
ncbi:homeobox protein vent1-like [Cololabis saira]|uniref:homeobox protein vent1-like n=1 Tax=Cololabis saira TaxID=129043 RepID=UPI002AD24008|nr:homeobox protein vent1-like [Cololabis saira]